MVSSSCAALRVVVPEPGGLGEPLRVTHSLTGGAGPPRPPAGLSDSGGHVQPDLTVGCVRTSCDFSDSIGRLSHNHLEIPNLTLTWTLTRWDQASDLVSDSDIALVRLDLTTALHANPKWLDRAFGTDRLLPNLDVGVEPVSHLPCQVDV